MSKIKNLKKLAQNFSLLYVEDNEILRESTSGIFEDLFKEVIIADDGDRGLTLYEEYFDSTGIYIDLVISDIQMPKMDGISLTKALFKINKKQKIIIVSAYSDTKYLVDLINIGVSGFMQKPLTYEHISSILFDVCMQLDREKELSRFLQLPDNFKWDNKYKILTSNENIIKLSINEKKLLEFFIENGNNKLTSMEIFEYIYFNDLDKEFSEDSIKSIIKRLRKKIPPNLIINTPSSGYSFNTHFDTL